MKSFRLTRSAVDELMAKYETPFLVASLEKVAANYRFFRQHLPRVNVFYAMKANPDKRIVKTLYDLGASFDVASGGEMEALESLKIPGKRMIYANPVKTAQGLQTAKRLKVNRFTFDDESEIEKMAEAVPGGEVLVRIRVHNNKALVDLNAKFGCEAHDAVRLLLMAQEAGLKPVGVAFHVGSQSVGASAYEEALLLCRKIYDEAEDEGLELPMLDIGGGLPIPDKNGLRTDLVKMAQQIERELDRLFPDTEIWAEPGRFLCGTAVNLVTLVIGTKRRDGSQWYTLDDGLYGSFSGLIFDHWKYAVHALKRGKREFSTLVGPSCDSIDFVARDILLPALSIGDPLLVTDCGAYSAASATNFNGFPIPKTYIYEEEFAEEDSE